MLSAVRWANEPCIEQPWMACDQWGVLSVGRDADAGSGGEIWTASAANSGDVALRLW